MIKRQQRPWWRRAAILACEGVAQQHSTPRAGQLVIGDMDVAVEPNNNRAIEDTLLTAQLAPSRLHNHCFSAEHQPNRPPDGEELEWLAADIKDEHPCFPHGLYLFWWPPHTMKPKKLLPAPLSRSHPGQRSVAFRHTTNTVCAAANMPDLSSPTHIKETPRRLVAWERFTQSVPLSGGEITPRVDGISRNPLHAAN